MSIADWDEGTLERFVQDRQDPRLQGLLGTALLRSADGVPLVVAVGTTSLTWAASTDSDTVAVDHGLDRTPTVVVASCIQAPAFGQVFAANASSIGATQFSLNGRVPVAYTGSISAAWIAVG